MASATAPAWTRPITAKAALCIGRKIAASHRIAVDGGIGERRQRQGRRDVVARMRPSACASETVSTSGTGVTRAAMMPTASSTDIIGPPKAKQSSDSCAMCFSALAGAARQHVFDRYRVSLHHSGDGRDVIEMGGRQRGFDGGIGRDARQSPGRPETTAACHWRRDAPRSCGAARDLKPSTTTRSTGDIFASNSGSRGSAAPRSSCISAQRRADDTSTSAAPDCAMHPGILAGNVDVETVMGVLDDGNAQALFKEIAG